MKYIYGLNKSGQSIIEFFNRIKIPFVAWDDDDKKRQSISSIYKKIIFKHPNDLDYSIIDEAFITPGISLKDKKLSKLNENKIKLYRDLELYSKLISKQKIIAITGTNGKSTTTKLIGDLIKSNNCKCFVGGNIGRPLIDFANLKDDSKFHVIELSSFQLESAPTFNSYISILLNISHDHLDRYETIKDYVIEKKKILSNKKESYNIISIDDNYCCEIYNLTKNLNNIPISTIKPIKKGIYILNDAIHDNYFFENKIIKINNKSQSLFGAFNLQNILATYVVSEIIKLDLKNFLNIINNFVGLPHRLEKIFEDEKFLVINNSKATNLDSTIKSISSYKNVYLIIGGQAKESNFSSLLNFKNKILKCYIIGESSDLIYRQLKNSIDTQQSLNLQNAVKEIFFQLRNSKIKSTVLFSPGCSSYDQFENFEDRGNKFKEIVMKEMAKLN